MHDQESDRACLFDSVTDTAFGPVFNGGQPFDDAAHEAQSFINWISQAAKDGRIKSHSGRIPTDDPRSYSLTVLMDCYALFRVDAAAGKAVARVY